jgi:uncharacterized protein (TIGR04255 family)
MTLAVYPRPPITEALIDISAPMSARQHELAQHAFPGFSAERGANETMHWVAPDRLRVIGVRADGFSAHVLAPYPGWASLRSLAVEAMTAFDVPPSAVLNVAVRYIDHIRPPLVHTQSWDELFTVLPKRPPGMPKGLGQFDITTESVEGTTSARLRIATLRGAQDDVLVLYDLTLRAENIDDWLAAAEHLHTVQRAIFEDSITETLRETFQ